MIQRITMFKVHNEADLPLILEKANALPSSALKDGKPYIREAVILSATNDDGRNQGYKLVNLLKFDSLEDMRYYDNECETHKSLKKFLVPMVEVPPITIYGEV